MSINFKLEISANETENVKWNWNAEEKIMVLKFIGFSI